MDGNAGVAFAPGIWHARATVLDGLGHFAVIWPRRDRDTDTELHLLRNPSRSTRDLRHEGIAPYGNTKADCDPRQQTALGPLPARARRPPTRRRSSSSDPWARHARQPRPDHDHDHFRPCRENSSRSICRRPHWRPVESAIDPAAVEAVHDALSRGETHYTDRPGILPLREKVASLLNRRFSLSFEAGQITLTCGVTEARFVTIQHLLPCGGVVAAPLHADRIAGAVVVRDGRLTHVHLEEADLLFAAAGATLAVIREWLAHVPSQCVVVYEVDTQAERFHPAQIAGFESRVVTIGSLDHEHGLVGARLGYLAAPAGQAAGLRDFKQALTICSTNLSQWAALAVVEDL